jgi:hypothetical protein
MLNLNHVINSLSSLEVKMSLNKNFYIINKNGEYNLLSIEDVRHLFNNNSLHVTVKDLENAKDYYPITDEIEDELITDNPYIKYCSERLVDLNKDPLNFEKYKWFISEWDSYLQKGERLINHDDYPYTHLREIRADISNYFKTNNIIEDKKVTLRFIRQGLYKTLISLGLMPYKHKSYRISKTGIERISSILDYLFKRLKSGLFGEVSIIIRFYWF